jgi:tetratricopeptide (TPR) repeat protein
MGGMAALATAAMFDFPLHRPETLLLMAILVALPFPGVTAPRPRRSWIVQGAVAALFLLTAGVAGMMQAQTSYLVRAGQELEADGAYRSAADDYRQALGWNWMDPDANFNLARALAGSRDFPEALAQTRTALRYLDEPELWIVRYRIQRQMGVDAAPELRKAAERFPYSKALAQEVEAAK